MSTATPPTQRRIRASPTNRVTASARSTACRRRFRVEHLVDDPSAVADRLADREDERSPDRVRVGRQHPPRHRVGVLGQTCRKGDGHRVGGRLRHLARCRPGVHRRRRPAPSRRPSRRPRRSAGRPAPESARAQPPAEGSSRTSVACASADGTTTNARAQTADTASARARDSMSRSGDAGLLRLLVKAGGAHAARTKIKQRRRAGGPRVPKPSARAGSRGTSTLVRSAGTIGCGPARGEAARRGAGRRRVRRGGAAGPGRRRRARTEAEARARGRTCAGGRRPHGNDAVVEEPLEVLLAAEHERRDQRELPGRESGASCPAGACGPARRGRAGRRRCRARARAAGTPCSACPVSASRCARSVAFGATSR